MKKLLMLLVCGLVSAVGWSAPIVGKHTFEVGQDSFLLDGKPFVIRCGEMHFARIPRDLWRHRIQMVRACGFNAVCAYMFWNNHEPVKGRYEFAGEKDVAEFCRIAQEEGLWVVLRPGPYTCAEWEFGGLPWWLLKHDGIKLRSSDERYLKPACDYLAQVAKALKANQITHGGNILMVQVENEYGFWGNDKDYMRKQYEAIRKAGFDVPAFCCNPPYNMRNGLIPELLPVVNFGSNPANAFKISREVRPTGPLMCGEYYPAWFDSWGERHQVKAAGPCLKDLEYMLKQKASFSVYMAHGGTTFGWWAGCNAPFRPQTSSYDYDAPVSEAGWEHPEKFASMKELFGRYLNPGETIPAAPARNPVQALTVAAKPTVASLWSVASDVPATEDPQPFEKVDLGYGYAVYRTKIPAGQGGELVADVRDIGVVRVDGADVGFFDRRHPKARLRIEPAARERTLEILVEEMARYNFGHIMHDSRKGILGKVTLGGAPLKGWTMARINLNEDAEGGLARLGAFKAPCGDAAQSGSAYRYVVRLEAKDTFLEMRDWKHGMVRVNGRWIGRYWSIGPTQTMYVPGCWLKDGENEIVILDVVGAEPPQELRFLATPILGEMRPETDFFAFQPRPKLAKPLAECGAPAKEGEFANETKRQDVRFAKPVKGRYFALETRNAWDGRQFAACGEIDLVDGQGRNIPHTAWTIAACDSEERSAEDGSAENLVDGQTANFWHTEWRAAQPNHPHYFVIDLGKEETVGGFNFTPRQSDGAGRVKGYRAYVLPAIVLKETPKPGPALVPYPQEVTMKKGEVTLASLEDASVRMLPAGRLPPNGYAIRVAKGKGVSIAACDEAGAFYARQTLKQLAKETADGFAVPCCEIKDWPAFGWRGIMWDDCRHFFGKEAILKTLDAMAAHKMNVFHWHLTEDQAWRIEIPKYPDLLTYGAVRPRSAHPDGRGLKGVDEKPYGPFYYTTADIREIVAYAKARHIRVIPEIELPGHALAAIAAYPHLSCRGKAVFDGRDHGEPWPKWGVSEDIFCAGNDETIKFLEDVLDHVVTLFPDEVVHIGGDEAPKKRWNDCPKCQARIKSLGLKNAHELQGWVTRHFTEYLAAKGKRAIGWDEITECELPRQTMVMNWHGVNKGIAAAKKGHDVVFTPVSNCYFDYRQCSIAEHQAKGYGFPTWAGELNLQKVHALDPLAGIPAEFQKHIFGVQGNLWTESVVTPEEMEWKLWPRAAAIAEIGWSGGKAHPYEDFKRRVDADMKRMSKAGHNVRK